MKFSSLKKSFALITLAAVAACGGSGSSGSSIPSGGNPGPPHGSPLGRIVGVGDSLTAGYQSNGFLGATGFKNPFFAGQQVPPNQPNGFWALLDEQASGKPVDKAVADMYDPAVSPLPLIAKPGLNNQIVPWNIGFPFTELKLGDTCTIDNGFNLAGYRLRGMQRVRMNPRSTSIRDVGVPGLTMHEANTLKAPQTSTCKSLPGIPGLLNLIIAQESGTFWPVLGNFTYLGPHLTEVNAAASKHPTLATVWLGANDVLKYMGSGGRFTGGNHNAAQAEADIRTTISTLQHAGARVVVANLPNIVETGFFQSVTKPQKLVRDCKIRTYADCLFRIGGLPGFVLPELAKKYHLDTPQGCVPASVTQPCGYLTLPGAIAVIQTFAASGVVPNLDCSTPAPGCKGAPGNGQGMNYITPAFAGKIQALNDAINTGIDNGAQASNVPLVDVQAIFHGLASGDPTNPYFAEAAAINPGICCTLGYLWGITSFDGLHPSNTGYALIANAFIQTINSAYGTHIPEVDVHAVYAGTRCSNPSFCFPDPYAPPNDFPYKP